VSSFSGENLLSILLQIAVLLQASWLVIGSQGTVTGKGRQLLSSNDISLGSSVSVRVAAEISLQALALKGGLSETFSKIVLRAVASAMTSVAHNRNDHLLIGFVVCENGFETFGQSEEFALSNGRGLQHLGLNLSQVEVAAIHAIGSVSASVALEEGVVSLGHQSGGFLVAHVIVITSMLG